MHASHSNYTSRGDAWRARRLQRILDHQCAECGAPYTGTPCVDAPRTCDSCDAPLVYNPNDYPTHWKVTAEVDPRDPEVTRFNWRPVTATIALALALIPHVASAAAPTFETPLFPTSAYLARCELRGAWDDGSRVLTCNEDGSTLIFDPDGQRWVNEAGAPVRAPGWYELEETR